MRHINKILVLMLVFCSGVLRAQTDSTGSIRNGVPSNGMPQKIRTIYLNSAISTHFISPEPIQTVDISSNSVIGDLPVKNVLRVKPTPQQGSDGGVITIIGQTYMAQFKFAYASSDSADKQVILALEDMSNLDHPDFQFSDQELYKFSVSVLKQKPAYHHVRSAAYGMKATLNNIYTIGSYFFIDVSFRNSTNIQYDIDQLRFKIEDKRIVKSTNVQAVEIHPIYQLYQSKVFKRQYRNIFVFNKFTFPGNKVFSIELAENQISGRVIYLHVQYSDVLNADAL